MKKALMFSSMLSTIAQFNMDNIRILQGNGCALDVAATMGAENPVSSEKLEYLKQKLEEENVRLIDLPVPRKISDIKGIMNAYKKAKKLCDEEAYALMHCHSPIGGVIARMAARRARKKFGTRVIYTAHGFHFFKGAPLINWLLYFPMEWICSFFTDTLITINREDFARAKKLLHAKRVEYIPGVGVDTEKIESVTINRAEKRKELGLRENEIAVLSVGELNDNKNHETILRAIAKMEDKKPIYLICGKGQKAEYLSELAKELDIKLILCGYRNDIAEVCKACDIFAFPSKREGLPVSLMEGMGAGMPCVISAIRGNMDLIKNGEGGFLYALDDTAGFARGLQILTNNLQMREAMGQANKETVKRFDTKYVNEKMQKIYAEESI